MSLVIVSGVFGWDVSALQNTVFVQCRSTPRIWQYTYLHGLLYLYWFSCSILCTDVFVWATYMYSTMCRYGEVEQTPSPSLRSNSIHMMSANDHMQIDKMIGQSCTHTIDVDDAWATKIAMPHKVIKPISFCHVLIVQAIAIVMNDLWYYWKLFGHNLSLKMRVIAWQDHQNQFYLSHSVIDPHSTQQ